MRGHLNECIYKHPFDLNINDPEYLNIYPTDDDVHLELKQKIANYVSVSAQNITLTAGADDSIALIISSLPNSDKRVIYKYSPAYMFLNRLSNTIYNIETPLKDRYKAMELYKPEDGSIIYICNPCNPTNDLWDRNEYLYLCKKYPKCIVIVDEAYMDFHDMEHSYSHINEYSNLFYVRTLSKLFGIANLRLGYFVHNNDFKPVYYCFKKVTNIAKVFANKIFDHLDFYKNIKNQIDEVKNKLNVNSPTNFIFLHTREQDLQEIEKFANDNNILIRLGYGNAVRISLQIDTNVDLIKEIMKFDILPDIRELYTDIDLRIVMTNMLRDFIKIADENNVVWWADGGTRIGAERHNAIIPWDDDIDIGILPCDIESILKPHFNIQRNLTTELYHQICLKSYDGHPRDTIHIDIFPFIKEDNKHIHKDYRFREHADGKGNFGYNDGELFPLRSVDFYDFKIFVPNQSLPEVFNTLEIRKDSELIYTSSKLILS
jgi:histidinol-phosphate/aromatic aminotransferase/cobyric acid decarboxylase-like protein